MSRVQYHVVVAFGIGSDGALVPINERAAVSVSEAVQLANGLAADHAGVIAFTRSMDIGSGFYGEAEVHVVVGIIPRELQSFCHKRRHRPRPAVEARVNADPIGCEKPARPMPVVIRPARWRR